MIEDLFADLSHQEATLDRAAFFMMRATAGTELLDLRAAHGDIAFTVLVFPWRNKPCRNL